MGTGSPNFFGQGMSNIGMNGMGAMNGMGGGSLMQQRPGSIFNQFGSPMGMGSSAFRMQSPSNFMGQSPNMFNQFAPGAQFSPYTGTGFGQSVFGQ